MKRSTLKFFLSMGAVMGLGVSANADLLYTFDTGTGVPSTAAVPEAGGHMTAGTYTWTTYYGGEVQHTATVSGWNLGGSGPKFEFSWPVQTTMAGFANGAGDYRVSFDVSVTYDWSFNYGVWAQWDWYDLHAAFNSDGTQGWTQVDFGGASFDLANPGNNNLTYHIDKSFAQAGWQAGDSWFQIFFGSNSNGDDAVQFFVDNIKITPEPSTFALLGLGAAAMLIFRRR